MRGKEKKNCVDMNIWMASIMLSVMGAVVLYSASAYYCSIRSYCNYDTTYFLKRQALFMLAGFGVMILSRYFDYTFLELVAWPLYWIGILCIFLLLLFGVEVNGAVRWLKLGPVQFQVAEIIKITVILALSCFIQKHWRSLGKPKMTIWLWMIGAFPAGLIYLISSDFSSAVVIMGIDFLISFTSARTEKMHLLAGAGVILAAVVYVLRIALYLPTPAELEGWKFRDVRIAVFLKPELYAENRGYQTIQGLMAVGTGGLLGRGLGNSLQKYSLPEPHTDMIISVMIEETGLFGFLMFAILLSFLLYQILRTAANAEDLFGRAAATGIFSHIATQALINLAVNVSLMPNTGLPLPFLSYGGTSITLLLAELALVLSIDRYHQGEILRRELRKMRNFRILRGEVENKESMEKKKQEEKKYRKNA